jgi:hypothetical protein
MDNCKPCGNDCGQIANERLLYFPGRYMSARDFTDEQKYFLTRHRLHNRILHGWGVVCGLHVHPHPVETCRKDHVKVECGIGLDCCGHELIVPKPVVAPPIPWAGRPAYHPAGPPPAPQAQTPQPAQAQAPAPQEQNWQAAHDPAAHPAPPLDEPWYPLLCLEHCETEIECVPVLFSEHVCDKERREFSRVSEGYKLCWHWVCESGLAKYHWKHRGDCPPNAGPDGGPEPCPNDDCYEEHEDLRRCCLDPQCPPDHCLPIALIFADGDEPITEARIVTLGRPVLPPPPSVLTRICHINWPHGGIVSRRHLEHHLRRLEVRFDRRLRRSDSEIGLYGPRGVNPATFVVQFGGGYEDLDFVTYTDPPFVEHDCVAVFTIDPRSERRYHELPYSYLENQTVYISLKCDFILDCHNVAVDGNHLGGILPSGDGVAGGTFESWFRVLPDHEWERRHGERQQGQEEPR